MLTVAPIGNTKEVTRLDAPTLFSTASIVTGSVAPEELVEKAMTMGWTMFRKCVIGLIRPTKRKIRGSVINKWKVRPATSISAYRPSALKAASPVVPISLAIRANTPIGATKRIMPPVRRIIASKADSKKPSSGPRCDCCNVLIVMPRTMEKKMMASIFASAAAAKTFSGTMSRIRSTGD